MTVKTIKISELNREDLELVAQWNRTMYLTTDSNEKLISRLYKSATSLRTQINVMCVVSENHKKKALATLAEAEKLRIQAAEQFSNNEGISA